MGGNWANRAAKEKKGNHQGKGFQKKLQKIEKSTFLDISNQENWSGKGSPPVTPFPKRR
jgi:hypothetical protein